MFGFDRDSVAVIERSAMNLFVPFSVFHLKRETSVRNRILSLVTCALVAVGLVSLTAGPSVVAQESGKAAKVEKGEGAKKAAKSGDRLPANYAKIGVSDEQRKKIYEIQNKYDDQIAAFQKQLADIRAKELAEVEAVLTPDQKKALQAANEESKKKAAEKKKAGDKGSEKTEKTEK